MGCDIHCYKEKFLDGRWVTSDEWEAYDYGDGEKGVTVPWKKRFTGRNYQLFGVLSAGVRGVDLPFSFQPRGLPFDACSEVLSESAKWEVDGHSHSYLFLHELKALRDHLPNVTVCIEGMKNANGLRQLNESIESGNPDWELVFPYCQWTNDTTAVKFKVDVPATFYLGKDLDELIAMFDGVEGENHRIVFFFDN